MEDCREWLARQVGGDAAEYYASVIGGTLIVAFNAEDSR